MNRFEPNFTKFILGPNLSSDNSSKHSSIRIFVIEYLHTCCFWLSILISIAILAFLIDIDGFKRVILFFVPLAATITWAYSSDFINYAAILWVRFKDSEEVGQNEFEIIATRIISLFFLNKILTFISVCIWLVIIILLVSNYGWVGLLFFATIFFISAILILLLLLFFAYRFKSQISLKHDYFLLMYEIYWEKDSMKNSSLEFKLNNGNILFTLFLIIIYIIIFYMELTLLSKIYFGLINVGVILLIAFRKKPLEATQSEYYREPYFPIFSKWVSKHISQSLIYDFIWTGFSLFVVIDLFPNLYLNNWNWLLVVIIGIPFVFFNRFFLTNGTIKVFKRLIDNGFNIIIFRRFSNTYAEPIKNIIYPNLGAYGRITSIQDSTFKNAESSINADSENILGEFNDLNYMTEDNWKSHIIINLRMSDMIVFCWMDEVTENMKWEFEKSLEICDVSRILIIVSEHSNTNIQKWLDHEYSFEINDSNYIIFNENAYQSFSNIIYDILKCYHIKRKKEF